MINYKSWERVKKEQVIEMIKKQQEFCRLIHAPCFIEDSGICPFCKCQVMDWILIQQAEREHITKCPNPKCNRSFTE